METKRGLGHVNWKAEGDEGSFTAIFATLGVVDHDGDVIEPTAFTQGQKVRIAGMGHDWSTIVGRGEIRVEGDKALVDGRFFLDTQAGLETYKTVKALDELQEWSFGFEVVDASWEVRDGEEFRVLRELNVFEVSPVLLGAGIGTQTVSIKELRDAVKHVKEGRVLSTANVKRFQSVRDQLRKAADEIDGVLKSAARTDEDEGKSSNAQSVSIEQRQIVAQAMQTIARSLE